MNRKLLWILGAAIICVVGILIYGLCSVPLGNTPESREKILESEISKGSGWTIAKEIEIDGYIVSAAYSTNGKVTLAVFEPIRNGKYEFKTYTCRDRDEIIIGGFTINGQWYDLIWFNGAQTEYAEVTYTGNSQIQDTLKYDTTAMDIISINNSAKSYTISVAYFDSDGNKYE